MRSRLGTLLALAGLLLTAIGSPVAASAPAGDRAGARADKVRIVLVIDGCGKKCIVGAVQAHGPEDPSYWGVKQQRIGKDGRVVFRVPAERTRGMSFSIRAPWAYGSYVGGLRYVITRYRGFDAGDDVSAKAAARARKATYCWAGTKQDRKMRVQVVKYETEQFGEKVFGMRAFMVRALPTGAAKLGRSYDGVLWAETPWCP